MKYLFNICKDVQVFLEEDVLLINNVLGSKGRTLDRNKKNILNFVYPFNSLWCGSKIKMDSYVVHIAEQTSENTFMIGCTNIKHVMYYGDAFIELNMTLLRSENGELIYINNTDNNIRRVVIDRHCVSPNVNYLNSMTKKIYRFIHPTV